MASCSYASWSTYVWTNIVHVNGLELTFYVSVNPIMKFIYTPCKCIIFNYLHLNVNVNIYLFTWFYMAM